MSKDTLNTNITKSQSTVARTDDGTIQLTFTIPFEVIKTNRQKALEELNKNANIPGFRKGKAPLDRVNEHISQNALLEKTLSFILPNILSEAIKEHKITPIIYPKFELIKAQDDEDWQVRAVTCEAPKVDLGDYKNIVSGQVKTAGIWKPGDDISEKPKSPDKTREEKEQLVLNALVKEANVPIPKILIEEEVNTRLANLLSRLEKLGLSLESYLTSLGKTADNLRTDYEKQSVEGLSLDFILNEVAIRENLAVTQADIDITLKAASQDPNLQGELESPERKRYIEAILKRRKALDFLLTLA